MFVKNDKLQYRNLGNSGLVVSSLAFGNAGNGEYPHEQNVSVVSKCLEMGINFFDTAELYWEGEAESSFGRIFKELGVEREKIVVSTKIWVGKDPSINSSGSTNRKHIKESMKASLSRLQMEYVDIIYPHSYDESTSLEETCKAFHDLIEEGLAFYWGTSNWDAETVFEAFRICEQYNWHKPIAAQNQYNMFIRHEIEGEYRKLFEEYKYGLVAFNTLLGGYLTGKYAEKDQQGRFNLETTGKRNKQFWKGLYLDQVDVEQIDKKLLQLKQFAEQSLGCKLAHLAIAWSLKFGYLSSAIIGARNPEQLEDSFQALSLVDRLTPEIEGKINQILNSHPEPRMDMKTWKPTPGLRPLASD